MHDGDDATFEWLMKKGLMCVPNPSPIVPGEKDYDAFTRHRMQMASHDDVAEVWEKDLGATSSSLLVYPPSSIAHMMAIADGYQYGYPQQRVLELVRSEHYNHTLYQFFKAEALKLEAKLRHREENLNSAEELLAAKDKEILELKEKLKGKQQLGATEAELHQEVDSLEAELEKYRTEASSVGASSKGDARELTWLRGERTRQASRIKELVANIIKEADKWNGRVAQHNKLLAEHKRQDDLLFEMRNILSAVRSQFKGTLEWTRESLHDARDEASRLEDLELGLFQACSSHDPDVRDHMQQLIRERDDARAEAHALSKALTDSRADVARLVESEKDLEVNMYRLTKGIEEMTTEVNRLHHLDSMKQVELDECQFTLKNIQMDYNKISDEYDFLDEARDTVVNEFEIASANVEELEGQLSLANEKLKETQSSLVHQQGQAKYYEGLAGSRDEAAKEAAKEVTRLKSSLSQSEFKATVIVHKARCQLAEEVNKTLTKTKMSLLKDHGIVKKYPRRPMPEPLTYTSDPSSGVSVPSSQKKNPAGHAESSQGK
ncbi:nucleoprotein TPR-like [Papaver somniferum]|uniref:nucleoprotein TPR-like n=1 Tax=Papaver somniferum TaxID=3469 RepID=UPI000E700673|nr:nucleoprotein TPR-like [Papaver somniferum]